MLKRLLASVAAAGAMLMLASASAVALPTINGTLHIDGPAMLLDAAMNPTTIGAGNGAFIDFLPFGIDVAATGDFAQNVAGRLFGPIGPDNVYFMDEALLTSLTDPLSLTPALPLAIYTFDIFTFTADAFDFGYGVGQPGNVPTLTVSATGIISAAGFEDTLGRFTITTQGDISTMTWSAFTGVVPEPLSVGLFGLGLLGLAGARRRRAA